MDKKIRNNELGRKTIEEFKHTKKIPLIVVLDNIRSQNNIGSVFRTSDAFLIQEILLCGITATPPHKDIHKTALGSTDSVDWQYFKTTDEAIIYLKEKNYTIIAIEQVKNSKMLNDFIIDKTKKYAVIFGHEVKGVAQNIVNQSDFYLEIPQEGTKHSLNISVSVGVVLWEFFKQMKV